MGESDASKKKSNWFLLAIVTAIFSFLGLWAGSCVNVPIEKQKQQDKLNLERQEREIAKIINEIEQLIDLYGQTIKKGESVLSFLRSQSYPVGAIETVDSSDITKVEKEFFELHQQVGKSYHHIISFYKIQIDGQVLLTVNGMAATIYTWRQGLSLQKKLSVPRVSGLFWLPEEILVIPPDDLEKCNKLLKDFEDIGRKELDYLTSLRKKLISSGGAN